MNQPQLPAAALGLTLKAPHVAALLADKPGADSAHAWPQFLELHAENGMIDGGPLRSQLLRLRERCDFSLHGVGLSLGGMTAPDAEHLTRLAALVDLLQPRWVSEHLAWSGHDGICFNDLLPLPYESATLARVVRHVDQLQQRLKRQVLIENPATYLGFAASTMDEVTFITELQRRTGCAVLLDVNNVYVSAINQDTDPARYLDAFPLHAVAEIHLAGFAEQADAAGRRLLIDDHGAPVHEEVWALYRRTLTCSGPIATLIERDNNVPPLAVLCAELHQASRCMREAQALAAAGARTMAQT